MVWGCSKICDLKKKSTTPLLDNLSPGSGVSFYKINSHIPYYAHEIFNGISLLKILTSFVVFDYKHSIITSNYGLTTLAERMTTTAKGIGDDVQHQRILSRICCATSSRSAARAFGGRDGQNYPFVAGKETCLSKLNGGRVCTWRLNGNSW